MRIAHKDVQNFIWIISWSRICKLNLISYKNYQKLSMHIVTWLMNCISDQINKFIKSYQQNTTVMFSVTCCPQMRYFVIRTNTTRINLVLPKNATNWNNYWLKRPTIFGNNLEQWNSLWKKLKTSLVILSIVVLFVNLLEWKLNQQRMNTFPRFTLKVSINTR